MSLDIKQRVLVIDEESEERDTLEQMLLTQGYAEEVQLYASLELARSRVDIPDISLCFVGATLSPNQQEEELQKLLTLTEFDGTIVAVARNSDRETIVNLVEQGAHGVLLQPLTAESLNNVVAVALEARTVSVPPTMTPSGTPLPQLLEDVANKLEIITERFRRGGTKPLDPSLGSKKLKTALLQALAATGVSEDEVQQAVSEAQKDSSDES